MTIRKISGICSFHRSELPSIYGGKIPPRETPAHRQHHSHPRRDAFGDHLFRAGGRRRCAAVPGKRPLRLRRTQFGRQVRRVPDRLGHAARRTCLFWFEPRRDIRRTRAICPPANARERHGTCRTCGGLRDGTRSAHRAQRRDRSRRSTRTRARSVRSQPRANLRAPRRRCTGTVGPALLTDAASPAAHGGGEFGWRETACMQNLRCMFVRVSPRFLDPSGQTALRLRRSHETTLF